MDEIVKKEIEELYNSIDLEDKISAILRDVNVGNFSLDKAIVRIKAAVIMELIERNPDAHYMHGKQVAFSVSSKFIVLLDAASKKLKVKRTKLFNKLIADFIYGLRSIEELNE